MEKATSKIIVIEKALNIIFNNYYLRAEVTSDLFVASGEGPKFFQNLHLFINVFLRIYESLIWGTLGSSEHVGNSGHVGNSKS
ncbi:hypothetical protein Avbf_04445 [Armadillidium vulgare]|nr:hypothetical protein Avbf_04445 [Armadillidium vulgare]